MCKHNDRLGRGVSKYLFVSLFFFFAEQQKLIKTRVRLRLELNEMACFKSFVDVIKRMPNKNLEANSYTLCYQNKPSTWYLRKCKSQEIVCSGELMRFCLVLLNWWPYYRNFHLYLLYWFPIRTFLFLHLLSSRPCQKKETNIYF